MPNFLPLEKLHDQYRSYVDNKGDEREMSAKCRDYDDGNQWTDEDIKIVEDRGQQAAVYNYTKRKVNSFIGVEEQTRRDPKALGRNSGIDEKSALVATKSIRFVNDNSNFPIVGMRSLRHATVSGIGGSRHTLDVVQRDVKIGKVEVDPLNFFYDHRSRKNDFSDAGFLGEAKYVSKDDLRTLLKDVAPGAVAKIDELGENDGDEFLLSGQDYADEWIDNTEERVFAVEHHYLHKGAWCVAYWAGNVLLHSMVSPYRDEDKKSGHLFNMWSPYVDQHGMRYGDVKDMLAPQDSINKLASKILHLLSSNQTMSERGAVEDVDEFKYQKSLPGGHMEVKPGAFDKIKFIDHSGEIAAYVTLLQMNKEEMDHTGPNNAIIGQGTQGQSGIAIQEQKVSGMTAISPTMQGHRMWKLSEYRKDWNLIRQYWTAPKIIRITDDPKSPEYIGLNQITVEQDENGKWQLAFSNTIAQLDVDIILDEGPDTITLQDENFREMMKLAPAVANTPAAFPPKMLIKASNLSNKDELLKEIEAHQQQSQPDPEMMKKQQALDMRRAELDMAEQEAKTAQINSQVALNKARARIDEIEADERLAALQGQALNHMPPATQTVQ